METKDKITEEQFKETLAHFTGTLRYWEHKLFNGARLLLTDGCDYVRKQGEAYWLFDLILSYQSSKGFYLNPFQVWKLKKQDNDSWIITCTDGYDKLMVAQEIEYSDFPMKEIEIWVERNTALLPSEH